MLMILALKNLNLKKEGMVFDFWLQDTFITKKILAKIKIQRVPLANNINIQKELLVATELFNITVKRFYFVFENIASMPLVESVFVLQSMFFHERILFVKPGVRCNRTYHKNAFQ